ncbi:MAG: biotin--[acetyl-CoA-carboxylase] ligase [Cytophagales bacterium]|nr:biotin--[acetyl-CoA-carboxylase] ligase [Cytophagales bacterium]
MYKIPAGTVFVGKNLVFVPDCHSTNSLAMDLSQRASLAEGTVVITDNQYSGRGQRGNVWKSEPGKNLTFSVVLKPKVRPDEQFVLTQVVALAVADYVATKTPAVKIKWPNDILVNEKKVCGILIESSLAGAKVQFVIAGVGLNINQTVFESPRATSLQAQTEVAFNLNTELHALLLLLETRYVQLLNGQVHQLRLDYHANLYRLGQPSEFVTRHEHFAGVIHSVNAQGKLLVSVGNEVRPFELKEIAFADWK